MTNSTEIQTKNKAEGIIQVAGLDFRSFRVIGGNTQLNLYNISDVSTIKTKQTGGNI